MAAPPPITRLLQRLNDPDDKLTPGEIQQLAAWLKAFGTPTDGEGGQPTGTVVNGVRRVGDNVVVGYTDGTETNFGLPEGIPGAQGPIGPPGDLEAFYPWTHGIPLDNRNLTEIRLNARGVWIAEVRA